MVFLLAARMSISLNIVGIQQIVDWMKRIIHMKNKMVQEIYSYNSIKMHMCLIVSGWSACVFPKRWPQFFSLWDTGRSPRTNSNSSWLIWIQVLEGNAGQFITVGYPNERMHQPNGWYWVFNLCDANKYNRILMRFWIGKVLITQF